MISYQRAALTLITRYAEIYPAVAINGPRQSGKTTLAKTAFPHLPYVSLEELDVRIRAEHDPRKFLSAYPDGAIFDEIQLVPHLLSYLQGVIDTSNTTGRFVITGSQNFALNEKITQSLAGRVGQVTLLPLSYSELATAINPLDLIVKGGYPRLHLKNMLPHEFYPHYIQSYIERDVRQIKNIENLSTFKLFTALCAGRVGQVLNLNTLAEDCSITQPTARQWLTILEASYIVFTLRPYHKNFNKRLTKSPKLYFYDTGVAASLLGIKTPEELNTHYARGALFENLIILEVLKNRLNRGHEPRMYFWREGTTEGGGKEIDLIDEWNGATNLFEIKSSHTFHPKDAKTLETLAPLFSNSKSAIVYGGPQQGVFGDTTLLSLNTLEKALV
ncbi:MAG: ATP-binding protein [bacterium]